MKFGSYINDRKQIKGAKNRVMRGLIGSSMVDVTEGWRTCIIKRCVICSILIYYEGNSISKIQIQVATYVFELSAGNCHR